MAYDKLGVCNPNFNVDMRVMQTSMRKDDKTLIWTVVQNCKHLCNNDQSKVNTCIWYIIIYKVISYKPRFYTSVSLLTVDLPE